MMKSDEIFGALEERRRACESERMARLELETEFEEERGRLQSRVDDAEYHLSRLNAYSWTRAGLTLDAAVKRVSKMLQGSQREARPKEIAGSNNRG